MTTPPDDRPEFRVTTTAATYNANGKPTDCGTIAHTITAADLTAGMTTTDTTARGIAAEALAGPWQAIAVSPDGWLIPDAEIAYWPTDDVRIEIVRGTATRPIDRIEVSVDFDFTDDELLARWAQAQAMVAGLNTAAKETTR